MTIALTINGTSYFYPENGDVRWGPDATDWASAVTTGMLQKAGGLFQLLANVDFGSGYGLLSEFYQTRSSNTAAAGNLRLATTDIINWRNAGNTADLSLAVTSGELTFNSVPLGRFTTVTDTNSIDLTLASGNLSGVVRLSASAADAGFQVVQSSIKSDGLFGQISKTFSSLTLTGASGAIIGTAGVLSSEAQLSGLRGGTGVSNAGTFTYGANNVAFTTSGATSLTLPTTGTLATRAGVETLTNKTMGSTNTLTGATAASFTNTGTVTLFTATDTVVGRDTTDTLTNKTMGSTNTLTGATVASITNTGTISFPTTTDTLVGRATTDTLTNKTMGSTNTLTGATIASITNSGTITVPTGTDTLVARATTDTLTNKTLTSPVVGTDSRYANQAIIKFYEQTGNGTNFIGFSAPNAVTADKTFKLPDGDGSNGQFLSTDGAGNLLWGSAAGLVNPMTTIGDMIYGGVSGAATRLVGGSANQVLQANGAGAPTWVSIANANVSASAAIAYSKLNLATSIVNADVSTSAAIAGSKIVTATASVAGVVDTGTQSFAGAKTFTGNLSVTGDTTVGVTGVTFNATPTLSASANVMEGYKEAAVVATMSFAGLSVGLTYASREARYTRIGNTVNFSGNMFLSAKGSSTGQFRLNLPCAIANAATGAGSNVLGGSVLYNNFSFTGSGVIYGGNTGDSFVFFSYANTSGAITTLTDAQMTGTSYITWNITYQTADAF